MVRCEYDGSELQYFGLRDLIHEIDDIVYSAIASIRRVLARFRVSRGGGVASRFRVPGYDPWCCRKLEDQYFLQRVIDRFFSSGEDYVTMGAQTTVKHLWGEARVRNIWLRESERRNVGVDSRV